MASNSQILGCRFLDVLVHILGFLLCESKHYNLVKIFCNLFCKIFKSGDFNWAFGILSNIFTPIFL